ncbi:MAG TPA: hypothetical protein VI758_02240, partial [Bacteroidota bacterium]
VGPRSLYESFYTHGFKAGVEVYGMCATAGYAGRWHNNNIDSYLPWEFPWETFQFTLTVGKSIFGLEDKESKVVQPVHGIVLAAGYSSGVGLGRMKETKLAEGITTSLSIKNIWSFEADFPIDEKSAIVSSFSYSRMKERVEVVALPIPLRSPAPFSVDIEMLSLESGYRYHPLEPFQPFFVQGSLGVTRMKPLGVRSLPNYSYKSYSLFTAGCELPLFESGLIVVPQVGVRTLFMEETVISSRLLGYNHAEYGVKLGYKL